MKIPLTYGALIAIVNTILSLALFFLGYHSDAAKLESLGIAPNILPLVVMIAGMALSVRARRAETPPGEAFSYGKAFATALLTGVISGVVGAILYFGYLAFINPDFISVQSQMQYDKLAAQGKTAQQIEAIQKMAGFFLKPVIQTIFIMIMSAILSVILGLIVAIFFRREAKAPMMATPPPIA